MENFSDLILVCCVLRGLGYFYVGGPNGCTARSFDLVSGPFFNNWRFETDCQLSTRLPRQRLVDGIVWGSIVLGVMILNSWPEASLWVPGLILTIELLLHGWVLVFIGFAMKRASQPKT